MIDAGRTAWTRRAARSLATVGTLVASTLLLATGGPGVAAAADATTAPPVVISHRGASGEAPEHTFAAYDRAVGEHTDVLECDLQLTKDDVLVCMHDTTVDRTTNGTATGRVGDLTLAQLRAMDFGSWFGPQFAGAKIVPFEEQLRCYSEIDPKLQFEAETKAPSEYGGRMEPALIKLLTRLQLIPKGTADLSRSKVIIQSFELPSLQTVKQLAPGLPTVWLYVTPPPELAGGAIPSAVDVLAPMAEYIEANPGVVAQAHAAGRAVQTWTVDDPAVMDVLLQDGVDGMFTNHTATLRARIDARTGHAPRRPVHFAPGCPGIAGTVTAASTAAATVSSTSLPTTHATPADHSAAAPATEASSGNDLSDWAQVVLIVLLIGAVGGLVAWAFARRRSG